MAQRWPVEEGARHLARLPRITPDFIAEETRALGPEWTAQEYECSFVSMHGLVYPDFAVAVVEESPSGTADIPVGSERVPTGMSAVPSGRRVGGIDFGWRNPFAAVWGVLDRDDVLWITGERYLRQTPLHDHAAALKALGSVTWFADPAGRTEIEELRAAGLAVRAGDNDVRPGIAAVSARLRTSRLKVHGGACPNLLAEARLYRYPTDAERHLHGENPVDADNHALAALRYLVSRIDVRFMGRMRRTDTTACGLAGQQAPYDDETMWTPLG